MGLTPLRLSGLEPGSHRLEVRYGSGFRPYAAKISLREGRTLSVSKELMQEPDMRELLLMGKMPRRKTDPGAAVLRALLPGFGAYYNGYRTQAPIISIISLTGVGAFFGNGGFKPYETNLGGMVAQSFFLGLGVFFYLSSILDAWVTADDDFTYPVFTEISLGGLGGSVSTRQGGNSPPQFIDGLSTPFAGGDLWFLSDSRSYCVFLGVKYAGFGEMRINTDMYYRFLKLDPILIGFGLTSDMAAPFAPQGRTPAVHQWLLAPAISLSFRETRLAWDLAMTPLAAMQHQCYVVDPETLEIMLERKTGWGPPAFGIWAKLDARYFFTLDFGIRLSAGYGWFDVMEGTVSMYGATLENLSFFDAGIGVVLRF